MSISAISPRSISAARHLAPCPSCLSVLNEATYTDYRHGYINEQALNAATYGFFEHLHLTGRLVINRLTSAYVDHNSKAQFYEKLRAAGFSVPRSLSTSDPDEAARFLDEVGDAVVKPAIGVGSNSWRDGGRPCPAR